jgi:hypothetical protein
MISTMTTACMVSMRFGNWKAAYCEQRESSEFKVWSEPFVCLRVPKSFNLRMDPCERADVVSDQYYDWSTKNVYLTESAVMKSANFLQTSSTIHLAKNRPASASIRSELVDAKIEEKTKGQSR